MPNKNGTSKRIRVSGVPMVTEFAINPSTGQPLGRNILETLYHEFKATGKGTADYIPVSKDHNDTGRAWGYVKDVNLQDVEFQNKKGVMLVGDLDLYQDTYDELKDGLFSRTSIEFYMNSDMYGTAIRGLTLLGSGVPHDKALTPANSILKNGDVGNGLYKLKEKNEEFMLMTDKAIGDDVIIKDNVNFISEFNVPTSKSETESYNDKPVKTITGNKYIDKYTEKSREKQLEAQLKFVESELAKSQKFAERSYDTKEQYDFSSYLLKLQNNRQIDESQTGKAMNLFKSLDGKQRQEFADFLSTFSPKLPNELSHNYFSDNGVSLNTYDERHFDTKISSYNELQNVIERYMEANNVSYEVAFNDVMNNGHCYIDEKLYNIK